MGEQLEFPNNYQGYFALGEAALAEGQLESALENSEAAYDLEQTIEANSLLAECYVQLHDFQAAKQIMEEMRPAYLANADRCAQLIHVLIGNREFIRAWQVLTNPVLSSAQRLLLSEQVTVAEDYFRLMNKSKLTTLLSQAEETPATFTAQGLFIQQLLQLPKKEYLTVLKSLLVDKRVFPILRSGLLDELVHLGSSQRIAFLPFQKGKIELIPDQTSRIFQQADYLVAKRALELEPNENFQTVLLEEVNVWFALFYPLGTPLTGEQVVRGLFTEYFSKAHSTQSQNEPNDFAHYYQMLRLEMERMLGGETGA